MALDLLRASLLSPLPSRHWYRSSNARRFLPKSPLIVLASSEKRECQSSYLSKSSQLPCGISAGVKSRRAFRIPRSVDSSSSDTSLDDNNTPPGQSKVPFGYTRKDVLLIGVGITVLGIGLKSGLEFAGFDSLKAGNVVQLVLVLGLTVGWISTYIFRVGNKDMTYAKQLRDYENKVMEKRLEGLTEAELEALLEQVDEEKARLASNRQSE